MTSVDSVPAFLLAGVSVLQPPHLEGDPSLATEILPGPPPLLAIQQGSLPRKDHKKSAIPYSYLPVSDPGTTYGGHMVNPMATTSTAEVDGPRRKRARLDKGSASGRAQRASARQLAAPDHLIPQEGLASTLDSDPIPMPLDDDDLMMISRSNSVPNGDPLSAVEDMPNGDEDISASVAKRPRRDKGKGKEKEFAVRVKEEPGTTSSLLQDSIPATSNEDHCSSCRSFGSLVYCDSCPRAFHLMCLNPPIEGNELQGITNWYCPACNLRQNPPSKPPASLKFMAPLFDQLQSDIPHEFQLPATIRTFFKDVASNSRGAYMETHEIKPPRLNRHGQLEDRDPYRLKDRNGEPVLCFKCGTSALPPGVSASAPALKRPRRASSRLSSTLSDTGKSIISCDYCHLHWHLDCVDPPLALMPPWSKKWMCPNHADQILKPKNRIPRHAQPIDVSKPGETNNGNVEVVQSEGFLVTQPAKMTIEEVLINGRRYRVPEKIITMDFWNKTKRRENIRDDDDSSAMSSPLTSLSSLEDVEDVVHPPTTQLGLFNVDELKAALYLVGLHAKSPTSAVAQMNGAAPVNSSSKPPVPPFALDPPIRIKEEPDLHVNGLLSRPEPASSKRASRASTRTPRASTSTAYKSLRSSARVQAAQKVAAKKTVEAEQTQSSIASLPPLQSRSSQKAPAHVNGFTAGGVSIPQVEDSISAPVGRPKRTRQPRTKKQSPVPITKAVSFNGVTNAQASSLFASTSASASKPTSNEDLTGSLSSLSSLDTSKKPSTSSSRPRSHAKPITPNPSADKPNVATTPVTAGASKYVAPAGSTTPSLKIRLPRLSSLNSPLLASSSTASAGETGKTSAASRSRQTRGRRPHERQTSASTSTDGPTNGTDGIMLPPV
ncbi:hypothetical protein BXZ70DRAFT_756100 [Cristinia sonorae]|uniref:PHD-type domain-containing protein n=1 Tax=Cristinia sonorae TaxID=1940300 RepID=A0A8K0US60_9AGAR|nr:hypothetical protein BXZ70DRAFT_756100 [Cristinia sonorae]